jgi:hypothetical protein
MMRRLARSRRMRASSAAAAVFDPATLSLTGWWRASYAGSPWTPTASAGASGSNGNLVLNSSAPDVGTAVNGYDPALFVAANQDDLQTSATFADLFNADAGTIVVLVKPTTLAAAGANTYEDPPLFKESGINFGFHLSDGGIKGAVYSGGWVYSAGVAAAAGSWALAQMTWNGTNMRVRKNGGAWDSVACGNVDSGALTGTMYMGRTYGAGAWLDAGVLEVLTSDTVLADADLDDVRSYASSRYGITV